jgi:D-3-phosphoglycerate dehydrogenase
MKDGVIIVNVARSGIFDEKSLADFVAAEKIRAVGFDVFEDEPCATSPLHEFDNAIITPHIGAVTVEAQRRAGVQIATFVAQGLSGSIVPTAVNISNVPPEVMDKFGPYLTACQMMGKILSQIEQDVPRVLTLTARGTLSSADTSMLSPACDMFQNACTIPVTVPKKPIMGATADIVESTGKPFSRAAISSAALFSSTWRIEPVSNL